MKTVFLGLMLIFVGLAPNQAESSSSEKEHRFVFRMKSSEKTLETFEFSSTSGDYATAFDQAAQACYRHFKGGRRLSEDQGLDIIDVCANPRNL